ncbi:MAG: DNA polymerase III subunit alpha [Betaproteobacteria bacterium]|nr:DNA polymerase III subunit alpha [Betaproteobacteria bacterium]MDE2056584.1 DNA polymerase III subunit alpha [Betaproteobacteria bacterium]
MSEPVIHPFVHLRVHTEYSITDGIVRISDLLKAAVDNQMVAMAITDNNNLFGLIKFYTAARAKGVKPIVGCEVTIESDEEGGNSYKIILLVKNNKGYFVLCDLLSRAYLNGQHHGVAHIQRSWLDLAGDGLIVLSGGERGDIGQALLQNNKNLAKQRAIRWQEAFGDNFYLEINRVGRAQEKLWVEHTIDLAVELDVALVATHPIQFLSADDYRAHEARVCIAGGYQLADPKRPNEFTREQYFKNQIEMNHLFSDVPQALVNSVEIAKRCNLELTLGKPKLPDFPTPPGMSLDDYLSSLSKEGLSQRLEKLYPDPVLREKEYSTYQARLGFELNTIIQMGFSGYFLIVADFINWAKNNGVPVGPGRGSGAGSLVAYCLGITDLDPLRYDLLFERFLNPERVSMPDFDVDFCQDGRDRVIEYVREKYGSQCVSQIATFGTMAAKAVIRDVGRVLELPYSFVDQLAKLIPFEIGITLEKAKAQEPQLVQRAAEEEEVAEVLHLGEILEGVTRNVGMHAGGVLIAPGKLTDFTPLYAAEGSQAVVSQFDKDDVEKVGLVKFDFLGLRTLTILDWTERFIHLIAENEEEKCFKIDQIQLDDPATYQLFGSGNTTAVFQQESRTAKDLEKRLQPDQFEDIIALMALNRPGPLQSGMVDDFINRKHGKARVDYFHQLLEPILTPTYGVIVYQEQVMQIAQILAGYTLGAADLLRRAMGKKLPEEMAKQRSQFIEGASVRGIPVKLATQLFDLMEKFAEYGFNKSHSAAYALISYQTAWLKAHHTAAFMAATLSGDLDDTDKVATFVEDARENNLEILPPDVNHSVYRFVPINKKQIRYGLGSIKGTGESAAIEIERARAEGGAFTSLLDFCLRTDKRIVNRRVVEALVKSGAFDFTGEQRSTLFKAIEPAFELAEQAANNSHQGALFGAVDESVIVDTLAMEPHPPWPVNEQLAYEKSVLGFYFSGHPFSSYRQELSQLVDRSLADLVPHNELVKVAGIVVSTRIQQTRRGRMGVVVLDDATAKVEVTFFNEVFEEARPLLKEDQILVIHGKPSLDNYTQGVRLTAEAVFTLSEARQMYAKELIVELQGSQDIDIIKILKNPIYSGVTPVIVRYNNNKASAEIHLPPVTLTDELLSHFVHPLSEGRMRIRYR